VYVRTIIYAGDEDYMADFVGVEAMVHVQSAPSPPHWHTFPFAAFSPLFRSDPSPPASLGSPQIASLNTTRSRRSSRSRISRITPSNGAVAGIIYKNAGTFSYARFFGAGHQVPRIPDGGRAAWCGGIANVHADHVGRAALWDMMCNVDAGGLWVFNAVEMITNKKRAEIG
jgi:hypothetical protein